MRRLKPATTKLISGIIMPNQTRPKKTPIYLNRLPSCNNACPTGNNIQAWLKCVQNGHFYEAWETIMRNNPFPAINGRICYHPCENACNRGQIDNAVNIHCTERFLGDLALQEKWHIRCTEKPTGKKILVVGAGPAGLSAAYHLRRLGHEVTIYEAKPFAGGMLHTGIPAFRLPRDILEGEIQRIQKMGVKIELNHPVTDLLIEKENGKFDAVFLGVGAEKDKITAIPMTDNIPVWGAVDWLTAVELKNPPKLGASIAIYGGGNTALDVARTAKRLGVKDVKIIYRRDRKNMPAFPVEVQETEEEGVAIHFLRTIKEINGTNMTLEIMKINAEGKPESTNQFEETSAHMLVLALGQDPETTFLKTIDQVSLKNDGTIGVDTNFMTGYAGVFAGGDAISSDRSVTIAVGHGRKAAQQIDAYLRNTSHLKSPKKELAPCDLLHLDHYNEATKAATKAVKQPILPASSRAQTFAEVIDGVSKEQFLEESKRCFLCGNCFECDGCYNICPVKAISKITTVAAHDGRYKIEKNCINCGKCFRRCPCGAITMVSP